MTTSSPERREGWVKWQRFEDFEVRWYVVSFVVLLIILLFAYFLGAEVKEDAFDFACFAFACLAGIIGGAALFYGKKGVQREIKSQDSDTADPHIVRPESDIPPVAEGHGECVIPPSLTRVELDAPPVDEGDQGRVITPPSTEVELDASKAKEKLAYGLSLVMLFFALLAYAISHDTCRRLSVMIQAAMYVVVTVVILLRRLLSDRSRKMIGALVDASIGIAILALICVLLGFPWNFGKAFDVDTLRCTDQAKHL